MKKIFYKFLYAVSIFLIVVFAIRLGIDYFQYDDAVNSAPFYTFIIERFVEFVVPSIIIFIVGTMMKKKCSK